MSGGKGGSSTSTVQIPAWLQEAAQSNLARADRLAQLGYTPYYGPDVAAFTPTQQAAFANTGAAANAFGMAAPVDPMAGMPQAQTFAGGLQGYSSMPLYEQSLAALQAARPGQFAALQAPFINPITGAQPLAPFGTGVAGGTGGTGGTGGGALTPKTLPIIGGGGGGDDRMWSDGMTASQIAAEQRAGTFGREPSTAARTGTGTGSFGLPDPMSGSFAGTNFPGVAGGLVNAATRSVAGGGSGGGYTGLRDMFDGGGPGRSGSTFSGGALSGTLNKAGVSPIGSGGGKSTGASKSSGSSSGAKSGSASGSKKK